MKYILAILYFVFICCKPSSDGSDHSLVIKLVNDSIHHLSTEIDVKFDLEKPVNIGVLPRILREISGLSVSNNEEYLYAVNDELGMVFKLRLDDAEMVEKYVFGKAGDYEGIEWTESGIYVVKSNGDLYNLNSENTSAEKFKTPLSTKNDVEGLCWDKVNQRLLLACKASPSIDKAQKLKKQKAIYGFDLEEKKLINEPIYSISDSSLVEFVNQSYGSKELSEYQLKRLKKRVKEFSPSGIAIDNQNDQVYILSSVGKTLIVLNNNGFVHHIYFLDEKIHYQPEGICFTHNGDLFISNEAKGLVPKIYRYKRKGQ